MRYPKYLRYLDTFGVISLASAVACVVLPAEYRPPEHLDDLWGNLSTEMVGIWLSVRLIDWIIRSHESFTKARVRVVRSMRYVERLLIGLADFRRPYDLKMLYRELKWIRQRRDTRFKYMKPDEALDVDLYFEKVKDLLSLLPEPSALHPTDQFEINELERYFEEIEVLEKLRLKAEANILDETDEDDGI